ncbi:acyltransferase family protein [Oceanibium sediminis]|uniref:acyltransferase family protein n=1 Tax=Oceanibium sediminis TaxID=2026339 RepID=UPI0018E4F49F|nr:acyltransferase [Oceanibium sediminis]
MAQPVRPRADPASEAARLRQVDSLRAIAILAVVVYHYAIFWTPAGNGDPLLPYGEALAWIPLAGEGHQGVYLFFIVSGFVITLSLRRAKSLGEFAVLRGIRLWPTLILCGSLTFAATTIFGPDTLRVSVTEYLVSLTFVPPAHVGKLMGVSGYTWLDGAYWTLWTEVRFYVLAGLMFFLSGGRFLTCWAVFFALSTWVGLLALAGVPLADPFARLIFAEHQPYFTIGIALAALRQGEDGGLVRAMYVLGIVVAIGYGVLGPGLAPHVPGLDYLIVSLLVFGLGTLGTLSTRRLPVLSWGGAVLVGQASYAYYLLHQNFGLAMLSALGVRGVAGMIVVQALVLGVSIALTLYLEAPLRRALRRQVRGFPAPVRAGE